MSKSFGQILFEAIEDVATKGQKVYALLSFESYEGSRLETLYKTKEAAMKFCEEKDYTLKHESPTQLIYINSVSSKDGIESGYWIKEMEVKP